MRIGVVRTDMGNGFHLDDLSSRNQYPYASQVPGQSRSVNRPTVAELSAAIEVFPAPVFLVGSDTNATVDTTGGDNVLRIRDDNSSAYTVITVTANAALAKATIRDELNAAFAAASLALSAAVVGVNQISISTTGTNTGPYAVLDIDTIANGSTLSTPVGFTDGATVTGETLAALVADIQTAVYPTAITIDVTAGTVVGSNANFGELSGADQTALTAAVANLVAPFLVETGYAQLSFVSGIMSELVKTTFQPGGARAGLPAGIAVAVLEDDGVTPFTFP